jgi:hypothetical protein
MSYQRGDRVVLVRTSDPFTRLIPGTAGTVAGYDERLCEFSDRHVPFDASELVFRVADMSVTLTARPGGSADEWFGPGGLSCFAPQRQVSEYLAGWLRLS